MNKKHVFIRASDRMVVDADEATEHGVVKDGYITRVNVMLQDGFSIDDRGHVVKDGKLHKVPLKMGEDGQVRPVFDRRKRKHTVEYDPEGHIASTFETVEDPEDDETERTEPDAAPALLADGSTVASHRPHFGVIDRATLERLDAIRATHDVMDSERWRGDKQVDTAAASTTTNVEDAREDAYRAYDEEMAAAHRKVG